MSEDETKGIGNQLFQRILTKLEAMDSRLEFVETKIRERSFDTRPIWEKALAEIIEINRRLGVVDERLSAVDGRLGAVEGRLGTVEERLASIDRKIDVLGKDMLTLRADHLGLDNRLRRLEA